MNKHVSSGVLCLSLLSGAVHAAIPYNGQTYEYKQPNGEVITLTLEGNDYYAEQRTKMGRLVIYDASLKGMAYAKVSDSGDEFISTGELVTEKVADTNPLFSSKLVKKYHREPGLNRDAKLKLAEEAKAKLLDIQDKNDFLFSSKALASNSANHVLGNVRGLTVMIQFPDEKGTMTTEQINNFLNASEYTEFGNKQSIRGYYYSVSGGKLDYSNTVVGYYTAKHNKSYYTDPSIEFSQRARELILEALNWLEDEQGFDFSTLSTNANKQIRGLNFMYAGTSDGAWSQGLWPHMGGLYPRFCADGVCTNNYQISDMSDSLAIGTFAHESGHLLFDWPDLYDYDGSSQGSVASYGIMGFGAVGYRSMYQPTPPVAPLRDLVGWDTVTEINPAVDANAPTGQLAAQNVSNTSYKWSNPNNTNEAFYIEAINQTGQNTEQLGSGLAIFHVDKNGDRDNEWHPYIQMEHADGKRDPENSVNQGDENDVYHQYGEFTATLPNALTEKGTNSLWWDGSESGLNISDVSQPGETITFLSTPNVEPTHNQDTGNDTSDSGNDNSGDNSGDTGSSTSNTFTGHLEAYSSVIEPNGSYFEFAGGGILRVSLEASANTDFGIALYQLVDNQWQAVAVSQNEGTSNELIEYNGGAGYYYVAILAYSGSGDYTLKLGQ